MTFAIAAFVPLVLLVGSTIAAETRTVSNWRPNGEPFPSRAAKVGDTLEFVWPEGSDHDVHIHPSGDCTEKERIFIGNASPTTYVVQPEDAGRELTFASDVDQNCEGGQIIKFLVTNGDIIEYPMWRPAQNPPLPNNEAQVGDIISFSWPDRFLPNVHIHPSGDCTEDGAIFVGDTPPTFYVIKEDDANSVLTFACDVDNHCEMGQITKVTVGGVVATSDGPAPALTLGGDAASDGPAPAPAPEGTDAQVTAPAPEGTDAPAPAPEGTDAPAPAPEGTDTPAQTLVLDPANSAGTSRLVKPCMVATMALWLMW